jgi:hypothetical protein
MRHVLILSFRLLLLVIALYAISNALKELLLREDELISVVLLVGSNMVIAAVCWSLGCWRLRERNVEHHGPSQDR